MTLEPLINASPAIQIHVAAAVVAFGVGGVVLFRRKGGRFHMAIGRVWVMLMLVVVVSSFFIHTIRLWGPWSPIHILSVGTIISLAGGIWAVRKRDIARHRRIMQATYIGSLGIAGFFSFMPGRIMYEVLFSGTTVAQMALIAAVILLGTATLVWTRRSRSRA